MPTFKQGQVVRVPFSYTDRSARQHRPGLVLSDGPIGEGDSLLWVAMITSAENRSWSGDHPIEDFAQVGLPIPSVVRPTKITTVEARDVEPVGQIGDELAAAVLATVIGLLGRTSGVNP
jgi:mRNA interferase MazF